MVLSPVSGKITCPAVSVRWFVLSVLQSSVWFWLACPGNMGCYFFLGTARRHQHVMLKTANSFCLLSFYKKFKSIESPPELRGKIKILYLNDLIWAKFVASFVTAKAEWGIHAPLHKQSAA